MALATLVVDLVLKAGGFESDMGRASKTAQKRMKEIEAQAKRLGVAIGTALAAGATALAYAIKGAIDRADELYNAAQKIGINVEALSALEYAAKQAGVELEGLRTGLSKLIKFQAAAAQGSKTAAETFAAFHIAVKDGNGNLRETSDLLGDWADVFATLKDGPEKVALAMRVFGKSGADLIPFLNEGREGIKELTDEARRLGIVIDEETGAKADQFNDQLDTLKATAQGVATQLAADLLPQLIELTNNLQEAAESGEAARKIEEVFHVIAIAGQLVGAVIQGVTDYVQALTSKGISAFYQWSGLLKTLRLDIKGAREDFAIAQREEDAAAFAIKETTGNIGRALGGEHGVAPKPVNWIDPPTAADMKGRRDPAETQAAAARLLAQEQAKANAGTKAAAAARRAAAEAAREQAQREKELAEELERVDDASKEFTRHLEDLAVAQGGPLAQAALQFKRDMEDLAKLAKEGERSTEDLATAEALLRAEYEKTTKEIEAREHPEKKLLEDMQFQLDLMHMLTDEERERAEFLREHAKASQEDADAYVRLSKEMKETSEQIAAADTLRDHFADAFSSILDGSKSAKEAFNDLAKSILADIARMIAKRWVEKLFGQYGTTGEGSWMSSAISAFRGSAMGDAFVNGEPVTAFAMGGIVTRPTVFPMARGMGLMGEAGPEAVMPLSRMANGKLGVSSGGRAPIINITVDGATTKETAQQVAIKVAQALKFAGRAL